MENDIEQPLKKLEKYRKILDDLKDSLNKIEIALARGEEEEISGYLKEMWNKIEMVLFKEVEGRVYWFPRSKGEKAILIFHAGYKDAKGNYIGFIHIYEHKETLPATELEKQIEKYGDNYMSWRIIGY